jgi:hypothetical protein
MREDVTRVQIGSDIAYRHLLGGTKENQEYPKREYIIFGPQAFHMRRNSV